MAGRLVTCRRSPALARDGGSIKEIERPGPSEVGRLIGGGIPNAIVRVEEVQGGDGEG